MEVVRKNNEKSSFPAMDLLIIDEEGIV